MCRKIHTVCFFLIAACALLVGGPLAGDAPVLSATASIAAIARVAHPTGITALDDESILTRQKVIPFLSLASSESFGSSRLLRHPVPDRILAFIHYGNASTENTIPASESVFLSVEDLSDCSLGLIHLGSIPRSMSDTIIELTLTIIDPAL